MLSLTVGCMYAGKTTALIRDIPDNICRVIDYDECKVPYDSILYSHDSTSIRCMKTSDLDAINMDDFDSILINEAQFFTGLVAAVKKWLCDGKHVYIYGLDGDFKQEPFGEILQLIPFCDRYEKLYATCECGEPAPFSKRLSKNKEQYSPQDTYVPVCRQCLTCFCV